MAAAAAALLRRSRSSAASFVTASFSLACRGIHLVDVIPRHARHRLAGGKRLRQLDLHRIHAGDVMHDDADLAAVLGERVCHSASVRALANAAERAGALFEAIGKGVGALARPWSNANALALSDPATQHSS